MQARAAFCRPDTSKGEEPEPPIPQSKPSRKDRESEAKRRKAALEIEEQTVPEYALKVAKLRVEQAKKMGMIVSGMNIDELVEGAGGKLVQDFTRGLVLDELKRLEKEGGDGDRHEREENGQEAQSVRNVHGRNGNSEATSSQGDSDSDAEKEFAGEDATFGQKESEKESEKEGRAEGESKGAKVSHPLESSETVRDYEEEPAGGGQRRKLLEEETRDHLTQTSESNEAGSIEPVVGGYRRAVGSAGVSSQGVSAVLKAVTGDSGLAEVHEGPYRSSHTHEERGGGRGRVGGRESGGGRGSGEGRESGEGIGSVEERVGWRRRGRRLSEVLWGPDADREGAKMRGIRCAQLEVREAELNG